MEDKKYRLFLISRNIIVPKRNEEEIKKWQIELLKKLEETDIIQEQLEARAEWF